MAHESFEDDAVASVLNEHFVSIKVDREERPDVDRVYMAFVQATTGAGGWPMSVWLTPDLKPFYGGTYFPPSSRWGRPGFVDILKEIARVWAAEGDKVLQSADSLTDQLRQATQSVPGVVTPGDEALVRTVSQFHQTFDWRHGGFGGAPKFPRPSELLLLLREHVRTGDDHARDMALQTLRAMALGGVRDHIGGGFHRYAVDAEWRVPHFEKMLYDQAQLVLAYLEGAQVARDLFFAEVAVDTLEYVMRELTHEAGGFFSAEDADSVPPEAAGRPDAPKAEGAFYLWRADEVEALLGPEADIVKLRFGIEPHGNAPSDPQQEFVGKNLLYIAHSEAEVARLSGQAEETVVRVLRAGRARLLGVQRERPRPHLDDKVLTAWNGLMMGAFARAARTLVAMDGVGDRAGHFLRAAQRAAAFIHEQLWRPETQTLLRRFRNGRAEIEGYAEDYAYLISGLLELFQTDGDPQWLEWARALQHRQDALFADDLGGGWFSTTGFDVSVLLRIKEEYDGAEPAASSVSVLNLLALSHLIPEAEWTSRIDRTLRSFAPRLEQTGRAVPLMACALSMSVAGVQQIVLIGSDAARQELARTVAGHYLPFAVVAHVPREHRSRLAALMPLIADMREPESGAAAYVCREFTCQAPVHDALALEGLLA
jgi:uncharacterized protein YyaL (SSP411 family)